MAERNVLLLVLEPAPDAAVREAVEARKRDGDVNVHVVAPEGELGALQWLTSADDEARAEAEELADRTAEAVDAEVETEVGEHDPVLAVEDALAQFPADEILVTGRPDEKTEAGLRRLGRPISYLDGGPAEETGSAGAVARGVVEGRRQETPFVVVGTVALFILGVIAVVSLIAFLLFWLA